MPQTLLAVLNSHQKIQRLTRPFLWHYYSLCRATKQWKEFPGALSQVCTHYGKAFHKSCLSRWRFYMHMPWVYCMPCSCWKAVREQWPRASSVVVRDWSRSHIWDDSLDLDIREVSSRCLTRGIQSHSEPFGKFWILFQAPLLNFGAAQSRFMGSHPFLNKCRLRSVFCGIVSLWC